MRKSFRTGIATIVFLSSVGAASRAFAGDDFIDTRITFLFSDDNILAGPKDFSPQADLTQRPSVNTFFDNYNTRDTGQETKTDLALYRRVTGWTPRLETEAAFLMRFDLYADSVTGQGSQSFQDDGTYVQVNWLLGQLAPPAAPGLQITKQPPGRAPRFYFLGFPFNADRLRLGYSYGITWGGREIFPKNTGPVPGMKFGWDGNNAYVYGAMKTHRQLNENTNDIETEYAFLGGAGWDVSPICRLEAGGGWFQKGTLPPVGQGIADPLAGVRINASGVSGQITFHQGLPIITSVDLRLYRNDADFPFVAYNKEVYGPGFSWLASSELSVLTQNLRDPDVFGATKLQYASAGDVNLKFKTGFNRFYGDVVYRDLAFLLFNVPSFTPYYAFPRSAAITAQAFFDVGADRYFPNLHQTPGIQFGIEQPATYSGDTGGAGLPGSNTVVIRGQGNFDILPQGAKFSDIVSVRVYDRVELSDDLTLIAQVTYTEDKNISQLVRGPGGVPERVFRGPNVTNKIGPAVLLQARF